MSPRPRIVILVAAGLALAAALGWLAWSERAPREEAAPPVAAPEEAPECGALVGFRYGLPRHQALRYGVRWRATWRGALPTGGEEGAQGRLDLDADLTVTDLGADEEGVRWAELRVGPVREGRFTLLGRDVPLDDLDGARAWARLDPCRGLVDVVPAEGAPAMAAPILSHLAAELSAPLGGAEGDDSWVARDRSLFGRGLVHLRVVRRDAEAIELTWRRMGYEQLHIAPPGTTAGARVDAEGAVTLDPRGFPARVKSAETVTVPAARGDAVLSEGRSQLDATLSDAEEASPPPGALARAAAASAGARDEDLWTTARERALQARIGGMTREQLLSDLSRFGAAGRMPDHDRWLWRATGLLEKDPTLAAALARVFEDDRLGDHGRGLVVDLLANVGHPEAQAALRGILGGETARGNDRWAELVQRFTLVQRPEPETVAFLAERWGAEEDPRRRFATALALGTAAGRRARAGDASAAATVGSLERAMGTAGSDEARVALLGALGNAGLEDALPGILAQARADSPQVRAAAAHALRKLEGERPRAALLELARDPDSAVQRAALRVLAERPVAPAALASFAASVEAGAIGPPAWGALLELARANRDRPEAAAVARAMQARSEGDQALRAAVTRAVRELSSP